MDIELIDLADQATAVVRAEVPIADIPALMDRGLHAVMAAVAASGVAVTGPPFARYLRMPTDTVDVEVGFPGSAPVTDAGEVRAGVLPAGRAVRTVHVGPYDALPQTYAAVLSWMAERGLTPAEAMWETYLSDPSAEPDPATWRTEITWPVA